MPMVLPYMRLMESVFVTRPYSRRTTLAKAKKESLRTKPRKGSDALDVKGPTTAAAAISAPEPEEPEAVVHVAADDPTAPYIKLIKERAKAGMPNKLVEVLDEMSAAGVPPDSTTYLVALDTLSRLGGNANRVVGVFDRMRGVTSSSSPAVDAAPADGQSESFAAGSAESEAAPTDESAASSSRGDAESPSQSPAQHVGTPIEPGVEHYGAVVRALMKASRVMEAEALLREFTAEVGHTPQRTPRSARELYEKFVQACIKAKELERALVAFKALAIAAGRSSQSQRRVGFTDLTDLPGAGLAIDGEGDRDTALWAEDDELDLARHAEHSGQNTTAETSSSAVVGISSTSPWTVGDEVPSEEGVLAGSSGVAVLALKSTQRAERWSWDSIPDVATYNSLIAAFGKAKKPEGALATIKHMKLVDRVEPSHETYEVTANALVRNVQFIKGAVDNASLVRDGRPEVAFLGLSNVGKSSLVNMVVNRRAIAHKSKKPGKTKEFNYFLVNDHFYLVDLPGLGYASVSRDQREQWSLFITEYLETRRPLAMLVHLMDAQRDPSPHDIHIMTTMARRKDPSTYAIALTKCDKLKTPTARIRRARAVREAVAEAGLDPAKVPVVLTSSDERWGRDDLWILLHDVLQ